MEQDKHIYIALDSDVLRRITQLYFMRKDNPSATHRDVVSDKLLANERIFKYLSNILEKAKADELRLLIVNTVFEESNQSVGLMEFITEFCYMGQVTPLNYLKKMNSAAELAEAYIRPYNYMGQEKLAPMKSEYNPAVCKRTPTRDARIMAEATIENACLLTFNAKDYIFNERIPNDTMSRTLGILNINKQYGYISQCNSSSEKVIIPRPFDVDTFGPLTYRSTKQLEIAMAEDKSKIKVSDIDITL